MGISPRSPGRAATARADRGTCRARTGNFLERRQRATSSGGGSFWRQGRRRARGGGRCRGSPSCWTPLIDSLKSGGAAEKEFPALQGSEPGKECADGLLDARRNSCSACGGSGGSAAAEARRRRVPARRGFARAAVFGSGSRSEGRCVPRGIMGWFKGSRAVISAWSSGEGIPRSRR